MLEVNSALCALAAVELLRGAGMTGVEVLSGLRMVDLPGDTEHGVAACAASTARTVLSVNSRMSRMGGMVAAPVIGALAGGQELLAGFAVSAELLVLPARRCTSSPHAVARATAGTSRGGNPAGRGVGARELRTE